MGDYSVTVRLIFSSGKTASKREEQSGFGMDRPVVPGFRPLPYSRRRPGNCPVPAANRLRPAANWVRLSIAIIILPKGCCGQARSGVGHTGRAAYLMIRPALTPAGRRWDRGRFAAYLRGNRKDTARGTLRFLNELCAFDGVSFTGRKTGNKIELLLKRRVRQRTVEAKILHLQFLSRRRRGKSRGPGSFQHKPRLAISMARLTPRALFSVSWYSFCGSLSATIPAPACR